VSQRFSGAAVEYANRRLDDVEFGFRGRQVFLAQRRRLLGSKHAVAHLRELGDMLVIARLDLLQLALDFGKPLGRLFRLADAFSEFAGFGLPARRLLARVCDRALQFGRALVGGVDTFHQRPRLTGRGQADGAEE